MPRVPLPQQTVRISQGSWDRLGENADAAGTDRSTVIRQLVDWYNRERGALLPERPPRES